MPVLPEGAYVVTQDKNSDLYDDAPTTNKIAKHLPWLAHVTNEKNRNVKFTCFRWLTLKIRNGGYGLYSDVKVVLVKPLYFRLQPKTITVDIGTGSAKFYYDMNPEAIETHASDVHPETMSYLVATTLLKLEGLKKENKL